MTKKDYEKECAKAVDNILVTFSENTEKQILDNMLVLIRGYGQSCITVITETDEKSFTISSLVTHFLRDLDSTDPGDKEEERTWCLNLISDLENQVKRITRKMHKI